MGSEEDVSDVRRPRALLLRDLLNGILRGDTYVKSRGVAARTPLSRRQAGQLLQELEDNEGIIQVSKYSTGGQTVTWKVSIRGE